MSDQDTIWIDKRAAKVAEVSGTWWHTHKDASRGFPGPFEPYVPAAELEEAKAENKELFDALSNMVEDGDAVDREIAEALLIKVLRRKAALADGED